MFRNGSAKTFCATYPTVQENTAPPPPPHTHTHTHISLIFTSVLAFSDQHLDPSLIFPGPGFLRRTNTCKEPSGTLLPSSKCPLRKHQEGLHSVFQGFSEDPSCYLSKAAAVMIIIKERYTPHARARARLCVCVVVVVVYNSLDTFLFSAVYVILSVSHYCVRGAGTAQWQGDSLGIERSRVQVPAGAAG